MILHFVIFGDELVFVSIVGVDIRHRDVGGVRVVIAPVLRVHRQDVAGEVPLLRFALPAPTPLAAVCVGLCI